MYINTARKVMEEFGKPGLDDGELIFNDSRCKPHSFNIDNFHKIQKNDSKIKIAFIDGGNCEIFSSSSAAVHFIRIYFNIFSGQKKVKSSKIEFYSAVFPKIINQKIVYKTKLFPLDDSFIPFMPEEKDLEFEAMDATLRDGIFMTDISKAASIARQFAEWAIIDLVLQNLDANDIIIRDGSLITGVTNEAAYFENAYRKLRKKEIHLGGLVKKTTLLTTTGKNFLSVMKERGNKLVPNSSWYYYPLADISLPEPAEMSIIKLHPRSDFVFRFERIKGHGSMKDILSHIAENSSDYRFPGYPYGLIDADRSARVSEAERKFHKTLFPVFENAHDILDRVFR